LFFLLSVVNNWFIRHRLHIVFPRSFSARHLHFQKSI
jgi:hypothetical protein